MSPRVAMTAPALVLSVLAALAPVSAVPALADGADEGGVSVRVAAVLPLTIPLEEGSSVPAATLEEQTAPGGQLEAELSATIDTGVSYAIDPMLIASIRALGTNAPASATAWLDRLAAASNPTFPLLWGDSDVTAPLQAGSDSVLTVDDLSFLVDPSGFAAPSDDDTGAAEESATPGPADLLSWDWTLPQAAWPRAGTVTKDDLETLAATDYGPVLVSSSGLERQDDLAATATAGGAALLVTDDSGSTLLASALAAGDEASWQQAVETLESSLASRAAASTSRTAVLVLDRQSSIPTERLAATVAALATGSSSSLVGLDELAGETAATATVVDQAQGADRVEQVQRMLAAESADDRFATVADDPRLLTGERRARLLVALSAGAPASAPEDFLEESETLRQSVQLAESSEIALLADKASLPVSVTNDLDVPVTVYITVTPQLPLIRVEDSLVALTIEPGSQARASVPVESLQNGVVEISISLHSAADVAIGSSTSVRMSVQAGWEGPVTITIGVLLVLVFAVGLIRGVRRRRAAARAEDAAAPTGEDPGPEERAGR
ncbi:MAG: DUF6049 family protein [Microbacteriaceae bacterium]